MRAPTRSQSTVRDWKALAGRVDDERYHAVLAQLEYQAGQAIVWRDAVVELVSPRVRHSRCERPRGDIIPDGSKPKPRICRATCPSR